MQSKKILITRKLPSNGMDLLKTQGFILTQWHKDHPMTPAELIEAAKDHNALLSSGWDILDASFFEQASHLDIISQFAVGYDNIDIKAATKHQVVIANAPGVLSNATADIAFGLMIAVSRNMFQNHKIITQGKWEHMDLTQNLGTELNGKTLGVFGLGQIGMLMAKKCAAAYNMKIIYHNRSRNLQAEKDLNATYVTFEELLQQSDVLSLHSNLTPETKGKFNAEAFSQMKPNAIFINSARGKMHNEEDLINALKTDQIWGAGLDVTNPEPMLPNNSLLQMPRVCVLPHIGSATKTAREGMSRTAAENIIDFYSQGKTKNQVNPF